MAILTFGTLYPLILVTGFILLLLPVDVPLALSTLLTVGIVAPAATYVVMPWVTRVFRRWLYPREHLRPR